MTAPRTAADIRASLELALANAVAEKGYAATTIADIVANARVSKRTFYEHFADKEECLMALYGDACTRIMATLRSAGAVDQPWPDRVRALTDAYLGTLDALLPVNRAVVVEMQAAGVRAYRMRQRMQREFAQTLVDLVDTARTTNPRIAPLTPPMALALVGGINELMLDVVGPSGEPGGSFAGLRDSVVALFTAVVPEHP
ncbi:TetR/AcrR family transcriptional regulator [Asanoa sp. WMMD1127]|uniref:TetR/AcrR family transcriptional regulator n=1 Tax=Asanoa sp. WMMD1127 TaxID=3016107 RepID=UPI002416D2F9|nr:TetR/AcrR family transcriptional regulator [Asanoa sp. WMMD1127]MDG4826537.1 TetR/AcrR family transcriptional regulator [Asanoa sp. WMMD1127]